MRRWTVLILIPMSLVLLAPAAVRSQTTSLATPIPGCQGAQIAPGPAVPTATPTASATGLQAVPGTAVATPFVGVLADARVSVPVRAAISALAACWNVGDWETAATLVTPNYLEKAALTADRATAVEQRRALDQAGLTAPVSIEDVGAVRTLGDGRATADVTWTLGRARMRERWAFVPIGSAWQLDWFDRLEVDILGEAAGFDVTISQTGLTLGRESVVAPGTLVLEARNHLGLATSLTVIRLPDGATVEAVLAGGVAGDRSELLVGDLVLARGEAADLVLVDLEPGVYAVVAGLRRPDGTIAAAAEMTRLLAVRPIV